MLIENEGALFRGPGRGKPKEVRNPGSGWRPFEGFDRPRGVEWGEEVSPEEAESLMEWRIAIDRCKSADGLADT